MSRSLLSPGVLEWRLNRKDYENLLFLPTSNPLILFHLFTHNIKHNIFERWKRYDNWKYISYSLYSYHSHRQWAAQRANRMEWRERSGADQIISTSLFLLCWSDRPTFASLSSHNDNRESLIISLETFLPVEGRRPAKMIIWYYIILFVGGGPSFSINKDRKKR